MTVTLARRAAAELEMRRRQKMRLEAVGLMSSIPADMTFRQWCEKLAADGMKVDGKPFRLDNRPALIPVYDAIPTTKEEAFRRILVIQKATQLGLTVWEVLANIYMSIKWGPVTIGMFMPDQATASYKSEHRFMRIVRSVPQIYQAMTSAVRGGEKKSVGEGNVLTRTMGESIFLFLWTSGRVSTESRPMDVVTLDEVQEMGLAEIDKVRARTGDSDIAYTLLLSTANMPELDINYWYLMGTQEVWHTRCPHCDELSDLTDPAGIFPMRSIGYNTGQFHDADLNEYVWLCPLCGGHILDPQAGEYKAFRPEASFRSFMLPRTISPRMTPREIIEGFGRAKTGDQKKSFYNRTLARPYIDADQLPVTMVHCLAAVEAGRLAGVKWEKSGAGCYMGIDQMGSFNAVIIKKRLPDGRQAVVHVEAVFANPTPENPNVSPFDRCSELMEQYGVVMCVIEQLPNVNDARRFANKHRGKVFLAGYANLRDDQMLWGDQLSRSDLKTAEDDRSRYSVSLNQYKCMQTALFRIRDAFCMFPPPEELEQDVIENGVRKRIVLLRDWVFYHFTKTALIVEDHPDTRKLVAKVKKVGIDPHYSFANMLCDVAWARQHGTSSFILPPTGREAVGNIRGAVEASMPGLPEGVLQILNDLPAGEVCGRCTSFDKDRNFCRDRMFTVAAKDPGCGIFIPHES
jgi:hypothetical protein